MPSTKRSARNLENHESRQKKCTCCSLRAAFAIRLFFLLFDKKVILFQVQVNLLGYSGKMSDSTYYWNKYSLDMKGARCTTEEVKAVKADLSDWYLTERRKRTQCQTNHKSLYEGRSICYIALVGLSLLSKPVLLSLCRTHPCHRRIGWSCSSPLIFSWSVHVKREAGKVTNFCN